jgi:hypothetical protein
MSRISAKKKLEICLARKAAEKQEKEHLENSKDYEPLHPENV